MTIRDIIDVNSSSSTEVEGLKAWGWVSYLLHLVVAVAAVLPGAQVSVLLFADCSRHRSGQAR